jgi:plastocyanin
MNRLIIASLVVTLLAFNIPFSYAEKNIIGVSIPKETSTPGCEVRDLCYIPSPLTVQTGDIVMWTNTDSVDHTIASGTPKSGPDGIIFSDILNPGEKFAFHFKEPGTFPYYCTIYPWMEGIVIVKVPKAAGQSISDKFELTEHRISSDGSTIIIIQTNIPKAGKVLPIEVRFADENDELDHMNYDIKVVQDGEEVFMKENGHAVDGTVELTTRVLESDNPINIEIGIRGIYLTSEPSQPVEDVITFSQVPEFGKIAILVLISSITALIMMSKTLIIPRF